jgi:hypothetical protein
MYRLTGAGIAVSGTPRGELTPRRRALGYMRKVGGPVSSEELMGIPGMTTTDLRIMAREGPGQLIYEVGSNGSDRY